MRRFRTLIAVALGGTVLVAGGCNIVPTRGPIIGPPPAPLAVVTPAYLLGDVIGGRAARVKKARAAGLKVLAPEAVADYVNRQEIELRRQTAGTGVDVIRFGELLLLRLPANVTFDVGRSDIRPQAESTLTEIALTLKKSNQSLVDVLGHTDSTGTPAVNPALSQRRAQSVASHLSARGVASGRIATKGYAATQPIADNATEVGLALNRRVEIKVVPLR